MKKYQDLLNSINESLIKNWFWLHILFTVFYVLYTVFKFMKGVNPIYSEVDKPADFNLLGFVFIIIGFVLIAIPFAFIKLKFQWLYLIAFTGYCMISFGHIKTVDKALSWEGSDVAWGNYNAAIEFKQYGILRGINDWNERANPYVQIGRAHV